MGASSRHAAASRRGDNTASTRFNNSLSSGEPTGKTRTGSAGFKLSVDVLAIANLGHNDCLLLGLNLEDQSVAANSESIGSLASELFDINIRDSTGEIIQLADDAILQPRIEAILLVFERLATFPILVASLLLGDALAILPLDLF